MLYPCHIPIYLGVLTVSLLGYSKISLNLLAVICRQGPYIT